MPKLRKAGQRKSPAAQEQERLNHEEAEMRPKSGGWLAQERRRESRIKGEDKVLIELLTNGQTPDETSIINALTKDISPGGVRIMTNVNLPVKTLLKMEIVLSQLRRRLHANGVVRWIRNVYGEDLFEMGIEFKYISPEDRMLLLEHTYRKKD
jgi:c-di-GMP-binding flagellar brake protein YcgR